MVWSRAGYKRVETFLLIILHVASNIQSLSLAFLDFCFEISLRSAAKSPSSLVRLFGVWKAGRVRRPGYLVCSLRGELQSQPRTM